MKLRIDRIAAHRNGISGAPFHAVLFHEPDAGRMIGIVFDEPYRVAVLNIDRLFLSDIAFGSNSWRGDVYEPPLRRAIEQASREVSS